MKLSLIIPVAVLVSTGCSARIDPPPPRAEPNADADAGVSVDEVEIVRGVADDGRDPAVVAVAVSGGLCSGSLIAPNVVLTARHCVAKTSALVSCPAEEAQVREQWRASQIEVLTGDSLSTLVSRSHGALVVTPEGDELCEGDIALLVLEKPIDDVDPIPVSKVDVVVGDRVRAVGFGRPDDDKPGGTKLLREHVRVLGVSDHEFQVGEATCHGDSGGPAIDESNGAIVGIVSRGGPSCHGDGVHNIYTRADAFSPLIDRALDEAEDILRAGDKNASHASKGKPRRPPSAMGSECENGADCSSGVCVNDHGTKYCSRACGSGDRCPAGYHCTKNGAGSVCLEHS